MDKSKLKGLKNIWFRNFIIPLIIINLIIGIVAGFFLKDYYYSKISDSLRVPLMEVTKVVDNNFQRSFGKGTSDYIVDNFKYKDNIAIEIIDRSGNILSSSEIRTSKLKVDSKDYIDALKGKSSYSVYKLKSTGEKIMSYSSPFSINGMKYGVIRFKVSMKRVDQLILKRIVMVFSVLISVLIFSYVASSIFIRSITDRLKTILNKSSLIGKGQNYNKFKGDIRDEIDILSLELDNMAEEIEASQKIKDEFMASVSHELKTPLTSIIGWSEYMLMDENADRSEVEKNLEIIHKESSRLKEMVESILDFSKYQAEIGNFNQAEIDLSNLIVSIIEQLSPIIEDRGLSIKKRIPNDIRIFSDSNALRQVLINIIDNSLQHSEAKNLSISLRSFGHRVILMIKDDGKGIDSEIISKIWESFYSASQNGNGFGLGLSISKSIVEALKGSIRIVSTPNRGTICFIVLNKLTNKD